jgi:hypothetical protein
MPDAHEMPALAHRCIQANPSSLAGQRMIWKALNAAGASPTGSVLSTSGPVVSVVTGSSVLAVSSVRSAESGLAFWTHETAESVIGVVRVTRAISVVGLNLRMEGLLRWLVANAGPEMTSEPP